MPKKYRTKAESEKDGNLTPSPEKLAVSTLSQYEHSISWHQEGKAYLLGITERTCRNWRIQLSGKREIILPEEYRGAEGRQRLVAKKGVLLATYYLTPSFGQNV